MIHGQINWENMGEHIISVVCARTQFQYSKPSQLSRQKLVSRLYMKKNRNERVTISGGLVICQGLRMTIPIGTDLRKTLIISLMSLLENWINIYNLDIKLKNKDYFKKLRNNQIKFYNLYKVV